MNRKDKLWVVAASLVCLGAIVFSAWNVAAFAGFFSIMTLLIEIEKQL